MKEKLFVCPSCGFLTNTEQGPGTYDICSVCSWEDDPVQLSYPTMGGGANKESLKECQEAILEKIPIEKKEFNGFIRDPEWRPLKPEDIKTPDKKLYTNIDYFEDSVERLPKYYWQKKV
jgi:rubredoxin